VKAEQQLICVKRCVLSFHVRLHHSAIWRGSGYHSMGRLWADIYSPHCGLIVAQGHDHACWQGNDSLDHTSRLWVLGHRCTEQQSLRSTNRGSGTVSYTVVFTSSSQGTRGSRDTVVSLFGGPHTNQTHTTTTQIIALLRHCIRNSTV
jgi:hypothetical protein